MLVIINKFLHDGPDDHLSKKKDFLHKLRYLTWAVFMVALFVLFVVRDVGHRHTTADVVPMWELPALGIQLLVPHSSCSVQLNLSNSYVELYTSNKSVARTNYFEDLDIQLDQTSPPNVQFVVPLNTFPFQNFAGIAAVIYTQRCFSEPVDSLDLETNFQTAEASSISFITGDSCVNLAVSQSLVVHSNGTNISTWHTSLGGWRPYETNKTCGGGWYLIEDWIYVVVADLDVQRTVFETNTELAVRIFTDVGSLLIIVAAITTFVFGVALIWWKFTEEPKSAFYERKEKEAVSTHHSSCPL